MNSDVTLIGNFVDPTEVDVEGMLSFSIKAGYIKKNIMWKSKDITAEFLGKFWENMLENENIKSTLHFVCAELLENAVYQSVTTDYMVQIHLCFSHYNLLVYVRNIAETEKIEEFADYVQSLLESDNLQKLFVQKMKAAKKAKDKKSQLGLITILKDRGAQLAWRFRPELDVTEVTTMAKISIKEGDVL